MIDETSINPDLALAALYLPRMARPNWLAMAALDAVLATAVRGISEPMLGQIKLAWWREELERMTTSRHPVVMALQNGGIASAAAAPLVDAWEALLGGEQADSLARFAAFRGTGLAQTDGCAGAEAWALADLARHSSSFELAQAALDAAGLKLMHAPRRDGGPMGRAVDALMALARRDVARGAGGLEPADHPARVLRVLRQRLIGR